MEETKELTERISNRKVFEVTDGETTIPKSLYWSEGGHDRYSSTEIDQHDDGKTELVKIQRQIGSRKISGEGIYKPSPTASHSSVTTIQYNPTFIGEIHAGSVQFGPTCDDRRKDDHDTQNHEQRERKINSDASILSDIVEDSLNKIMDSVREMREIECKVKGCELLEEVTENPTLAAIPFDEYIEMLENTNSEDDHIKSSNMENLRVSDLHRCEVKRHRHVMVCAGAGQGKTCLLRHYSRQVAHGWIKVLGHIRLVIYIQFRQLTEHEQIYMWQFITGSRCPFLKDDDKKDVLHWMVNNQEKVLFTFDGLDEYIGNLLVIGPDAGYYTKHKLPDFIRCILSGHLFQRSTILTSTREHAIANIPQECYPSKIITMHGFEKESIHRVIQTVCGDATPQILKHLEERGTFLHFICSIPFYLTILIGIILKDPANPPDTLTSFMVHVLFNLSKSNLIRSRLANIHKVTKLAFYGMKNDKNLFNSCDLETLGVVRSEIVDYTNAYSSGCGSVLKSDVKEDDMEYGFSHKLFMEFYAALGWLHLMQNDESFVEKGLAILKLSKWHYVKLFVFGVLFNDRNIKLLHKLRFKFDANPTYKTALLDNFKSIIMANNRLNPDSLQLLFESRSIEDQVLPLVKNIVFLRCQPPYDIACLMRGLTTCKDLDRLVIKNTEVFNDELMEPIIEKNNLSKVSTIELHLPNVNGHLLGRFIARCNPKVCDVKEVGRFQDFVEGFCVEQDLVLKIIYISFSNISYNIGMLMEKCKNITHLNLYKCNFDEGAFESFCEGLSKNATEIESLSFHKTINPFGKMFAELLSRRKINRITVMNKNMFNKDKAYVTEQSLAEFNNQIKCKKEVFPVEELCVTHNSRIMSKELARMVDRLQVKELNVYWNSITLLKLKEFIGYFIETDSCPLQQLKLSYNEELPCKELDDFLSKFSIVGNVKQDFVS